MKIVEISLENFRSFKGGPHVIRLGDMQPGLHFITGDNRVDVELGANGAGKSTIFDAVNYALFGKTLQGITAAASVSWGARGCAVVLRMQVADNEVVIERGRDGRTNYLRLNGKEASQEDVDRTILLNESLFAQAMVRKQFAVMFFDRSPADQLKMLTDMLELDYWDERSSDAKKTAKQLESVSNERRKNIARLQGELDSANQSAAAAETQVKAADDQHKISVESASATLADRKEFAESQRKRLDDIENRHAELRAAVAAADADITSANVERQNASNIAAQHRHRMQEHAGVWKQWESRILHFKSLTGACPTCEQQIQADHVESCIEVARAEMAKYDDLVAAAKVETSNAEDAVNKIDSILSNYNRVRKMQSNKADDIEKEVESQRKAVNTAVREMDAAQQLVNSLNAWSNPHIETMNREKRKAETAASSIDVETRDLETNERNKAHAEFWVDGFRRIRLFVIDRAVTTLEVEVNSSLTSLGLKGYKIHFATERVNKSGGVSRKFDVLVSNPSAGDDAVPLAAWSGGEYQRLRLACELGVSNMILKARGVDAGFEIWDEPTTHLSPQGVDSLLVALKERARLLNRQVWLIDHVAHDFAFDSVTRVVKTSDGSRFETEGN